MTFLTIDGVTLRLPRCPKHEMSMLASLLLNAEYHQIAKLPAQSAVVRRFQRTEPDIRINSDEVLREASNRNGDH